MQGYGRQVLSQRGNAAVDVGEVRAREHGLRDDANVEREIRRRRQYRARLDRVDRAFVGLLARVRAGWDLPRLERWPEQARQPVPLYREQH